MVMGEGEGKCAVIMWVYILSYFRGIFLSEKYTLNGE